jgi:NADH/F420H2 dehydrogenase subunit C
MAESPPEAAGRKPVSAGRAEPIGAEVSRAAPRPGESVRTIPPPSGPVEPPPPSGMPVPPFVSTLEAALPDAVEHVSWWVGDWTVVVRPSCLTAAVTHLRRAPDADFDVCSDVTAVDWPPRTPRFDVIYCLYSMRHQHRVRIKARLEDGGAVASVSALWPAAAWLEREVYDLFGIRFEGHPDLRRILMPDEWQGHPQRKDYPLEGPGEMLMENPMDWLRVTRAEEIE